MLCWKHFCKFWLLVGKMSFQYREKKEILRCSSQHCLHFLWSNFCLVCSWIILIWVAFFFFRIMISSTSSIERCWMHIIREQSEIGEMGLRLVHCIRQLFLVVPVKNYPSVKAQGTSVTIIFCNLYMDGILQSHLLCVIHNLVVFVG